MIKNWRKELSTNTITGSILEKYSSIKTSRMIIFKGGTTRNVPIVQDTSDMNRTQEDSTDCLVFILYF